MTDPRFAPRLRESLEARMFAQWTAHAACRTTHPGVVNPAFFADDLAQRPEDEEYVWPSAVLEAMKTCAGCPVRHECLDYAYDSERDEPSGRMFGVFGGIPGRQRERFAAYEDRTARSDAWFMALSERRRWTRTQRKETA